MDRNWLSENKADLDKIGVREYPKGNLLLFNSYHDDGSEVVSNFYTDCSIWINGKCYDSVEKLFNCIVYGDSPKVYEAVMKCGSGREIKKIVRQYGRELPILESMRILRFAIRLKYLYNNRFRAYFNRNRDKVFVEDEYWSDSNIWGAKWDSEKRRYVGYNVSGRLYNELKKGVSIEDLYIGEDWKLCGEKIDRKSIGVKPQMKGNDITREELIDLIAPVDYGLH